MTAIFVPAWAVGSGPTKDLLTQHWNGTAWSVVQAPPASENSILYAVSCKASSDCWAVGSTRNVNFVAQTLVGHWDGNSWSHISSPNSGTGNNFLYGVSCLSATDCWAVGSYVNGSNVIQTLIEHWNGNSWSIISSPNNTTTTDNILQSVTCTSTNTCWAVGYYNNSSSVTQTLIEQLSSCPVCTPIWSIVNSSNSSSSQNNQLAGVTCASSSSSDCWAVGYYVNSGNVIQTLTEHWNGNAWSLINSPNNGTSGNLLSGVTCTASNDCWAVGYFRDSSFNAQTSVEHWNGTSWSIASSPSPGNSDNFLKSVACPSPAQCWAVGDYQNYPSDAVTLAEEYISPPLTITFVSHPASGHFVINGQGPPLFSISIEASPDLITPFQVIGSTTPDSNGAFQYDDATAVSLQRRFYRASYQ